eukprot:TRINITY_DN64503_c0_g1_i1.p1 TRINITY_DN64503_c0_g1~~TRINITY_DN64503_c0_g1_i1.p1  ORF type:complete len:716 (-),score=260.57 TRINITY_DN64503_c0_g1_i1:79-2226(-)
MARKAALVLLLGASGASASGLGLDLTFTEAADKARPIKKVVGLMKAMQDKINAENDKDTALKEKFDCWCKKGTADKEKAIAENKEKIQTLTSVLEENKARVEQLGPEIREHKQALAAAQAAIEQATTIRDQQIKSFKEDEQTLLKSVDGVKEALKILKPEEAKKASLLELSKMSSSELARITRNLQNILDTQDIHIAKSLTRADRDQLDSFIKNPKSLAQGSSFLQEKGAADSIVGILIAMADDFGADLAQELKEEKENKKSYEDLMKAKTDEIEATTKAIAQKTEALAKAEETVVTTTKDLKLTKKTLAEDEKFMALVQEKCANGDDDYNARVKARQEEIAVLDKTLEVLTSDEARDLDSSAMSFLQTSESTEQRAAASKMLATAGQRLNVAALMTLSLQAKINSFKQLKEKIDKMVAALKKQQADEVAFNDECKANLNKNELDTDDKKNKKTTLESKIDELKQSLKEAKASIKSLTDEIAELNQQMAGATEERQKESLEFQADVNEQKQVQALLQKAMNVLKKFYGTVSGETVESFLQVGRRSADEAEESSTEEASAEQPSSDPLGAPEQMKDYKKNSGGLAVSSLLGHIIEDSKKTEFKLKESEQDSQTRYEAFSQETANSIKSKTAELDSSKKQEADDAEDLSEAKGELISTMDELTQLGETKLDLHKECDFTMANFEVRQKAREEEMDALVKARGILGGADFTAFLQHSK